ncbi:MAG: PAS domain-containing protein, partial [Ignavibacteriaceae bacterium]
LTGWKENEAQGKNLEKVFNIVNEETGKSVENSVRKILSTKTVVSLANHVILISKTGKEIPMADSGAPIINDDGKTIGVVFVFKDQTAEREAEKKLGESEEKNRALLSAIPDLIFLISKEGVFLDYRSSEQEKLLLTPEQFLGKQIYDVLPPDIAIITQEKLNKLFEKREPQVCEYQLPSEEEIKNYECRCPRRLFRPGRQAPAHVELIHRIS